MSITSNSLRLLDLEPEYLRVTAPGHRQVVYRIAEAQGLKFLCPKCFKKNGGPVGTHSIICWSADRGTPPDESPLPGRWLITGTGMHNLTLDCEGGKSRSVLLLSGCGWHGFVTAGEVTDA